MGVPDVEWGMFVRRKRNASGSVSVQIIDKSNGYKVVKTLGSATDPDDIERLVHEAAQIIRNINERQIKMFSSLTPEDLAIENFLSGLANAQVRTIGPELIFGTLFDRIGFGAVPEELFRHITIARLAYPVSKLKTVDYLFRYRGLTIDVNRVYRFLDRMHAGCQEQVEQIAYEHTKKILAGHISVVFYDLTTLYFEAEEEDDLRRIGFSKDGKFTCPQILLGLLVGKNAYPIGYDIFEGNTFEGHTLIPVLKRIRKKYGLEKPIVVADAGLLSKKNLEALSEQDYEYILGARIKNESRVVQLRILKKAKGIRNGQSFEVQKPGAARLIVTFSEKRARKDAKNREKGLRRLRARLGSEKLAKKHINNRGYNKFLKLTGDVSLAIDEGKVKADEPWDGLKGYVTKTRLKPDDVIEHYGHLWQIEKAFRISKTDLRVRPMFHHKRGRIEAHVCIAFAAYAIYKELERLLIKRGVKISPKRAAELTQTMYEIEYVLPGTKDVRKKLLKMDEEQQLLHDVLIW